MKSYSKSLKIIIKCRKFLDKPFKEYYSMIREENNNPLIILMKILRYPLIRKDLILGVNNIIEEESHIIKNIDLDTYDP